MNLQQLRYVIEVERSCSITSAAKNLFMGQPNLSKSIKELESEIGITLFSRNSRGVEPTPEGMQFLRYAKNILNQMDELKNLYTPQQENSIKLNISVPRATYVSVAFSKFLNTLSRNVPLDIKYKETNSVSAISNVSCDDSSIALVRYQNIYEEYFLNLMKENNLQYEVICEFQMCVMMSKNHPLAKLPDIPYHLLSEFIEIAHGDFQIPSIPPNKTNKLLSQRAASRIYVYDRGSQFDFLNRVNGTYLWVSPVPQEELDLHGLVQKKCSDVGLSKDIVVYRNRSQLKSYELQFIEILKDATKDIKNIK
ncbi:LysR family transcriptional regulator [Paludicola sp. MB14-C6]|uniref:LysR family transcriptional regulator n=1 Tax=Paludihabitans sp. MB14-C6 TaxID=3070656 RepID=UPI0027DC8774|nr:LysR family transcriptional regulator [Paludicola sp. MB14-C6]WMJ24281.1 LysR family transcriptional regulator [Paludicola sp. MB14-C6]